MEQTPDEVVAPLVLLAMVAHDPGEWFEEALDSVAGQDYPNVHVLVVDTASEEPLADRVGAVLPDAEVLRLDDDPGYAPALNRALLTLGDRESPGANAALVIACHDDVAFDTDAVRLLLEEAFRSNAGVLCPKLVEWSEPRRLLAVGTTVDKTGVPASYVEVGELDQQQHDAVRDVFAAPGACLLFRADLFRTLGGFDDAIPYFGEGIDLSWRCHLAGARVLVVPAARVRHRRSMADRTPPITDQRKLEARHRLRTTLSCYSAGHLLRVMPQAFVIALVESIYALLLGQFRHAADVAGAWTWNLRHLSGVRRRRKALRGYRQARDRDVRRLQVRGSARTSQYLRGQIGPDGDRVPLVAGAGRQVAGALSSRGAQVAAAVWVGALLVLLVGSRELITDGIPAIGQFAPFPSGGGPLIAEWRSAWRAGGLGGVGAQPTALGALGALGYLFLGYSGLLRTVLIVGMLFLGPIGMWRLLRPVGAPTARAAGVAAYVALPLGVNAMAGASWEGLVGYATLPFVVSILARSTEAAPFGSLGGRPGPGVTARTLPQRVLAMGLLLGIAMLISPAIVLVAVIASVGLVVGSVLVGQPEGSIRALGVALGGALVAVVLQFPWTSELFESGWRAIDGARPEPIGVATHGEILRFQVGPIGAGPLGWALLIAAAFALLVAKEWRLAWAVRGWFLALAGWGTLWAGEQGWLPRPLPHPSLVLAPAAVGIAIAVCMGVAAFRTDLTAHRFGWRQAAAVIAGAALVVGVLPVVGQSISSGRWDVPSRDYSIPLSVLDRDAGDAGYRILWLGDPTVLPLTGWLIDDGLAFATSDDGGPTVDGLWPGSQPGATPRLETALGRALAGDTRRLGESLAPMGVRYIVMPLRLAPDSDVVAPPPPAVVATLDEQLDLVEEDLTADLVVYRNDAWAPVRTLVDGPLEGDPAATLAGGQAVLPPDGYAAYEGPIEPGSLFLSATAAGGWQLEVDGQGTKRDEAFDWANGFTVEDGGEARLSFATGASRTFFLFVQFLLWSTVFVLVLRARAEGSSGGSGDARRARRRDEMSTS